VVGCKMETGVTVAVSQVFRAVSVASVERSTTLATTVTGAGFRRTFGTVAGSATLVFTKAV